MKVVITNTVALNGGDAAILLGVVKLLRTAFGEDTRFVVFDSQPEAAMSLYPEFQFRELWHARATRRAGRFLRKPRRAFHLARLRLAAGGHPALLDEQERSTLQECRDADLFVSTGGTYLVENYPLQPRLFEFQLARRLGKPLVLLTQSLGPFRRAANRQALADALGPATLVLLRDEPSRRHLLELGLPEQRLRLAADAAFALDPVPRSPRPAGSSLRVAISVREWAHFQNGDRHDGMHRFGQAMAGLTAHLVTRHGAHVTFLSSCQGVPAYRYDDSAVATRLAASLPEPVRRHVTVDRAFHRPEELIHLLQGFDLLVATRMHMAILSLIAGLPVLPIAYEFKTRELFHHLGMGRWVHDINTLESPALAETVDRLLQELPALGETVAGAARAEHARALASATLIRDHWKAG
jgi:colanic acid/amylovoran biosynthesis protein